MNAKRKSNVLCFMYYEWTMFSIVLLFIYTFRPCVVYLAFPNTNSV